jgi:glycosyltransferase involved in cell wall biosynthesis
MLSLCLLSLRSVNIIHVHTIHRLPIIDRWCLGRADLIICSSNFSKNFLCGYGLKPQRIRVIYNGINPQEESTQEQKTSLRRELGLDEGVPLVCYAGRIVKWKNLEMLIRAIAKVRQSCFCGAKFIFAGDTPQVPGNRLDYRQGLLKLAKNLRVEKDIIFIGRRQDMQNIFSQIDIFVIPSLLEVCSMAILEAMACAKPVVALNSGGNPELVSETAGILVKPGDIAGFGKAISDLLNDTERSRRMGREAKAQIAAKFSLDKNIKELEDAMLCVL